MIDPGSIVSATGFILGAINFLLTALSKLDEERCEFYECQDRLRAYKLKVSICQSKIRTWILIWHGADHFDPDTYKYSWSDKHDEIIDGFREMHELSVQIVDDILGRSKESKAKQHQIKAEKYQEESFARTAKFRASFRLKMRVPNQTAFLPQDDDWRLWRFITGLLRQNPDAKPEIRDVSGLYRIALALVRNQTLEDRLDRLKKGIANIAELSQSQFTRLQGEDSKGTYTDRTLQRAECFMACVDKLSGFTEAIYEGQKHVENTRGWALELRIPDHRGNLKEWDRVALLDLDFTFYVKDNQEGWTRRRLRVLYDRDAPNIPKVAMDLPNRAIHSPVVQSSTGEDPAREFQIQQPSTRKSRPFRRLFLEGFFDRMWVYKAWEADRARLALSLVNWMVLLWSTSWTANPCCCGLRFAQLPTDDPSSVHTFTARHLECGHNFWKLQNLGVVLAELITARALRVLTMPYGFEYQQWQRSTEGGFWKVISREQLLQEVDEKSRSKGIVKAVGYCLDNRSNLAREDFRPQFLLQLIESIFTP
jgi:hypothetical protein